MKVRRLELRKTNDDRQHLHCFCRQTAFFSPLPKCVFTWFGAVDIINNMHVQKDTVRKVFLWNKDRSNDHCRHWNAIFVVPLSFYRGVQVLYDRQGPHLAPAKLESVGPPEK